MGLKASRRHQDKGRQEQLSHLVGYRVRHRFFLNRLTFGMNLLFPGKQDAITDYQTDHPDTDNQP